MSFADIIKTLSQRRQEQVSAENQTSDASEYAPRETDLSRSAPGETEHVSEKAAQAPEANDLDDAIHLFESIQDIIGDKEELIKLPTEALLSKLPDHQRGPNWGASSESTGSIGVDAQTLLDQLRKGRIELPFEAIHADIPEGLARLKADDVVELDIATVYASIPPELIEVSSKVSDYMDRILSMPDYFSEEHSVASLESADAVELAEEQVHPLASEEVGRESDEPYMATEEIDIHERHTAEDSTPEGKSQTVPQAPARPQIEPQRQSPARVLKPATLQPANERCWAGSEQSRSSVDPVDVNHAGRDELMKIRGVGKRVADAIMRYREIHGSIDSIYDLLCIPGIGSTNFEMMTGLSAQMRQNRHGVLNRLLGFKEKHNPSLSEIAQGTVVALDIGGCVVSGRDGIMIAKSAVVSTSDADLYASLAPKFFRGVGKYIPLIKGRHSNMLALPGSEPKLLFVYMNNLYLVFSLKPAQDYRDIVEPAAVIAAELDWRFSKRAVVAKNFIAKA